MRNVIYISLTTFALTACSAINPAQQHNTQHANHGQYQAQGQYVAQGQYAAQSQYSAQGQYANQAGYPQQYTPAQTPQYNQASSYNQAAQYGQTSQVPALRGSNKASKFNGYLYGTLGLVNYDTNIDNYGIEGRIGYQASKYFGAEIEGSIGIADETINNPVQGVLSVSGGVNANVAIFNVARLPVTDRIALHGRIGYDYRRLDVEVTDAAGVTTRAEGNLNGFAYGFGGEYALTSKNRIRVDYTLYESELGTADGISVSYKRKF